MPAQPGAAEQSRPTTVSELRIAHAAKKAEAAPPPPKNPNREILNRRPSYKSEPEHVMAVIAKSKSSAIESDGKQKGAPDPLDVEIASYGFLTQLRPNQDKFDPPMTITLKGTTYVISEVFNNQDGKAMLRNPNGGSVELSSIVGQTADEIRRLLPPAAENEPEQITFVRAYMESQQKGGAPVSRETLEQGARAAGIPVTEDILEIAVQSGQITGAEKDKILNSPKAPEPAADGTAAKPPEVVLSANAMEIQKILGSSAVPTPEQVKQVFDQLKLPYSRSAFVDVMRTKSNRMNDIAVLIETAKKSGNGADAVKLTNEAKQLEEEIKSMAQIQETLSHFKAGDWNALESYYDAVETGTLPEKAPSLPALLEAFQQGDDRAILNMVGDDDMIKQITRGDVLTEMRKKGLKAGAVIIGLNALMIFLAMRKKDER